jgi:phenylalanyl-tRNA synthetase beta chain
VRVPLSWLCDFTPLDEEPARLAEVMDELGLVVEEIQRVGEGLSDVVVARVLEIAPIPNADRIRRVVVEAGSGPVEVVCGAWNFSEDDIVPFAPVGAVLPGGFEITRRKMKGVTSNGMLCSGRELALSEDHEGILVLGGSPPTSSLEPGTPLVDALGIERDVVFDIAVDANRPDAACIAGVARDVAARLHLPFDIPTPPHPSADSPGTASIGDLVSLEVRDLDLCPRFTLHVLSGVSVGPSPAKLANRLVLAGMRPINNVVDASNYVMLELGQPTHPYDLERLASSGIIVRAARRAETVVTLDGVERVLGARSIGHGDDMRDCVICDAEDAPIGIGGVMGGTSTEIEPSTSRVLLEAAFFTPMAIARTSKRLGLRTEASSRFERGVDPEGIDRAAERFCELLSVTAGQALRVAAGSLDIRGEVPGPRPVKVRTARVNSVLGTELSDGQVARYLKPIGFGCEIESPGLLEVTVPTFRPDTEREIDVVEEVARHHGYRNIPRTRTSPPQVGRLTRYQRDRRFVRDVLAGLGADEAWTPSLIARGDHERAGQQRLEEGELELANPLTPDEAVLRRSLLPGLLKALSFNAARRDWRIRLFEIGHVFPPPTQDRLKRAMAHDDPRISVVDEREMLGAVLAGHEDDARAAAVAWATLVDAIGAEGVSLKPVGSESQDSAPGAHPTRTAHIVWGDTALGVVGEVDPAVSEAFGLDAGTRIGWIEVDLGTLLERVGRRSDKSQAVSRFPYNDIDLAFVLDDGVAAGDVSATLARVGGDLLESLDLFDVYRGPGVPEGSRSITWRLRFTSSDHTLTDEEVGTLRARCIEAVRAAHEGKLRE